MGRFGEGGGDHERRCPVPILAAFLALLPASASAGPDLEAAVFPELTRFDLDTGVLIDPPGAGADTLTRSSQPVRLRAARGEVVAFQVRLRGATGVHVVRADQVTDAQGDASPVAIEVFAERGLRIPTPSESSAIRSLGPGRYPDALIPTATVSVPAPPGIAALWVDVFVPAETAPGRHRTALSVGRSVTIPIELDVLDIALPQRDVARLGAVSFGALLERGQRNSRAQLEWMQLAHAHHLSIEIMRPVPRVKGEEIDWAGWADRVGPYVDGSAFSVERGYRGPRPGLPVTRFIIPLTDWWPTEPTRKHLPADPARWSRTLNAWERFVEARGWFDRPEATDWIMFINSLDEPKSPEKIASLAAYGPLIEAAELSNRNRVSFRVDGNFGQRIEGYDDERQAEELGPVVDLWNVHGAAYTAPWSLLSRRIADHAERVMFYASNTSGEPAVPPLVIDSRLAGARAWGWIVFRYGLDGALNWEVDHRPGCVAQPKCSPGGALNLDATLIYRGEELGERWDQPIASMRLKALRRGAQDAALLALLAERDAGLAEQLAGVLIPRALGDELRDGDPPLWPDEPASFERARTFLLGRLTGSAFGVATLEEIRARPSATNDLATVLTTLVIFALAGVAFVVWRRRLGAVAALDAFFSAPTFFVLSALFIFYATTMPWDLAHAPSLRSVSWVPGWDTVRGRIWSIPDMVQNVVLFMPFGFFGALAGARRRERSAVATILLLGILGLALSAFVETLQTMSATRSPSATDLVTNLSGAAVGAAVAEIFRAHLGDRIQRAIGSMMKTRPGLLVLMAYLLAVVVGAWAPFLPSLDVGLLRASVRGFLDHPWGPKPLGALAGDALLFGAVGYLAACELPALLSDKKWLPRTAARASVLLVPVGVLLLAAGLELGQLFILGHSPGVQDAVVGCAGGLMGVVLALATWGGRPLAGRTLGALSQQRTALVLGFAILAPTLRALQPFELVPIDEGLARISSWQLVPFWALFSNLNLSTFRNVFEAAAIYLPLGYALAATRRAPATGFLACLVLAELLEVAQIAVAARVFDITEGLYAGLMGLFGAWIFRRYGSMRPRPPARSDTKPMEPRPGAPRR